MGWRDQLRVASFRGVRFHIEDVAGEGGRRAQVVEYPLRDEPFVEDLGRKARRYRLAAYVLGPDYGGARDALIKACEESGPGTLIHPFQGEIRAVCDALSYAESRDRGGHCRFDLSFVEAGAASAPADSPATQYVARQSADLATGSALSDFRRRFRVAGRPDFVAGDALAVMRDLAATISGARGLAGGAPSLPLDLTLARLSSNDAAVPFAQDLAETVNRSIQLFRSSSSMPGGFAGLRRLSVFGVDRTPVQPSTPSRRQQGDNRDALRFLVRRSAAIEQSRLASYAEFGDPDATRAYRVDFSSAPAFGSLPDWTADAAPSDRLPPYNASSPPLVIASNQEGLAFRDRAREDLDRAILDAGDAGDDDSYDSLTKLRTATVNDISVRSSRLSPVVPYDTPRSMPSLTLAHRLYGDANRSADLERRNRPPHPAFMPARGEALAE